MTFFQKYIHAKEKNPGTEPAKDPDKTCVEGHDRAPKTKDKEQLEGPHVLHNMKYGSEDVLGIKTKVSTVKGTKEGRVQTVDALADSGASTLIISWDLVKKVFDKGDAILKDESQKYMGVIQSKQGWQKLKEGPPDGQGNKSIQAITSGGRQVEEVIQSKQGR